MRGVHVEQVDLNLVPALAALLDERHVSRAAQRMQLTQPAMSRVLARLRRQFSDDLLVRSAEGYRLTPRAKELHARLRDVIPDLEQLFARDDFDPATSRHDFRLVGTDYAVLTFGPALFGYLLRHSPGSSLCFENWGQTTFSAVEDGAVDLVFYGGAEGPAHLRRELLFTDTFLCVMSADHPLAGQYRVPMSDYLTWPHLVVSVDAGRQPAVDDPLARLGTSRRAGLTLPFHAAAATSVAGTNLIATVPKHLLATGAPAGTVLAAAPAEVETLEYAMLWSPRVTNDPAHGWLRQAVRATCADIDTRPTPRQAGDRRAPGPGWASPPPSPATTPMS